MGEATIRKLAHPTGDLFYFWPAQRDVDASCRDAASDQSRPGRHARCVRGSLLTTRPREVRARPLRPKLGAPSLDVWVLSQSCVAAVGARSIGTGCRPARCIVHVGRQK
jgi:hypothetical protein